MRTLFQGRSGNVDRHKKQLAAAPQESFDDLSRFFSAATAQFDERVTLGNSRHDLVCMSGENLRFGPREVVLIYLTDRFEKPRAQFVVKILREQILWLRRKTLGDVFREISLAVSVGQVVNE